MANYQLNKTTQSDLDGLYLYGILNHGLVQADRYYDGLIERFELLSQYQSWGSDYNFIRPGLCRYEYGAHSIYYKSIGSDIIIVRVLGNRQDPARHF